MKLEVNFKKTVGKIKPMNAVNNGPVYTDNGDQNLTNLPDFREANIPFARTHDSSICAGPELAKEIEARGYDWIKAEVDEK